MLKMPAKQALEFATPASTVPCFTEAEREQFARELSELGRGFPISGYGIEPADWQGSMTIDSVARLMDDPRLMVTIDGEEENRDQRSLEKSPLLRRFMRHGVRHYQRLLPGLEVNRARVQVISDSQALPYNLGGLTAHTDCTPSWVRNAPKYFKNESRLCFAISSIDPGTYVCRIMRPLPHGSELSKLLRAKVGRNKGPHPEVFMRTVRRSRGLATVTENRGGDAQAFHGESVHWRGHAGRDHDYRRRYFAVLDLYVKKSYRNSNIIDVAAKRQLQRPKKLPRFKRPLQGRENN